ALGGAYAPRTNLDGLISMRQFFATIPRTMNNSIQNALVLFFIMFVFRVILRKQWLAVAVYVLLFAAFETGSGNPWVGFPTAAVAHGLVMFVLLRFGLIAFATGIAVQSFILRSP